MSHDRNIAGLRYCSTDETLDKVLSPGEFHARWEMAARDCPSCGRGLPAGHPEHECTACRCLRCGHCEGPALPMTSRYGPVYRAVDGTLVCNECATAPPMCHVCHEPIGDDGDGFVRRRDGSTLCWTHFREALELGPVAKRESPSECVVRTG